MEAVPPEATPAQEPPTKKSKKRKTLSTTDDITTPPVATPGHEVPVKSKKRGIIIGDATTVRALVTALETPSDAGLHSTKAKKRKSQKPADGVATPPVATPAKSAKDAKRGIIIGDATMVHALMSAHEQLRERGDPVHGTDNAMSKDIDIATVATPKTKSKKRKDAVVDATLPTEPTPDSGLHHAKAKKRKHSLGGTDAGEDTPVETSSEQHSHLSKKRKKASSSELPTPEKSVGANHKNNDVATPSDVLATPGASQGIKKKKKRDSKVTE